MVKKLKARRCYGHLGGELGEILFLKLVELEWIKLEEGKSTVYEITQKGLEGFEKMGIKVNK